MPPTERQMDVGATAPPPTFSQLGILVLDGSAAMADPAEGQMSRAQAVGGAVRATLARFAGSRDRRGFSFALVTFDDRARVHTPPTRVTEMPDDAGYDPVRGHGGTANICAGLRVAQRLADEFLAAAESDVLASVVTILVSGGGDDEPAATLRAAEEMKRNPDNLVCSAYFGRRDAVEPATQRHLRAIATYSTLGFTTVYDEEALRKFLIASISVGMNLSPL